jgi:hypothetical protein
MQRRNLLLGAGALGLAAPSFAAEPNPRQMVKMVFGDLTNGQYGADLSGVDFKGVQKALAGFTRGTSMQVEGSPPDTANRVVLDNLPTVAAQGVPGNVGDPGSCEAESFGYCLGAYTAARHPNGSRKWSAALPENQPSCAWLYEWQHVDRSSKVCPAGSQSVPYTQKLVATGAPSEADVPYNPNGATTVAGECANVEAVNVNNMGPNPGRLILGSYKGYSGIQNQQAQYLDQFKTLIRDGHAIAFTGLVPKQYGQESPPLVNGAYTAPQGFITGSGHGQVIVGFDDGKGPHGAFLIQNSFGPDWNPGPASDPGHNGRIWYAYEAFFAGQQFALIAFPNNEQPPAGPKLSASNNNAPDLHVKEGRRYMQGGNAYLVLILHGTGAVMVNQLVVTGPKGLATTATLNETIRFGYAYVERKPPFQPGTYQAKITGTFNGGTAVTYTGSFNVA